MGTNLPYGRASTLEWLEGRIDQWALNPAAIGLTSAQVATLQADVAATRDDFETMHASRNHAQSMTFQFNTSADALHAQAADLILAIKAFAATSGNGASVYVAANLSPKGDPSPADAPLRPTDLGVSLENSGSIVLSWEGAGPTGTLYEVYRKLTGETDFVLLGNVDAQTKAYVDDALPVGATFATYMVRGVRGKKTGPFSTQFNVQFGPTPPTMTLDKDAA